MKFIGKADQIQIILIGLIAIYGENAKIVDVINHIESIRWSNGNEE